MLTISFEIYGFKWRTTLWDKNGSPILGPVSLVDEFLALSKDMRMKVQR